MNVITRSGTEQIRRDVIRDLLRRLAAGAVRLARSWKVWVSDFAAAGQLGPDPETVIGRWTGARV